MSAFNTRTSNMTAAAARSAADFGAHSALAVFPDAVIQASVFVALAVSVQAAAIPAVLVLVRIISGLYAPASAMKRTAMSLT